MKTYDPIEYYDQGGSGLGQMKECSDGDWVKKDDAIKLRDDLGEAKSVIAAMLSRMARSSPGENPRFLHAHTAEFIAARALIEADPAP